MIACLGYHDVADDPSESGFQRNGARPFKLGVRFFSDHLDQVAEAGWTPGLVGDIELTKPGRHVLLTFDDGGKSAIRTAAELSRRGWLGHFFITTSRIGERTFLDPAEIRQLRAAGHLVGSHSHTHPDIYRELERERMLVEWRQSSDILAQIMGEPCLAASVPGGEISKFVLQSAGTAGLRHLFTSEPWLTPRVVGGCWILGRYCPKVSTSADEIAELVRFQGWAKKLVVRRFKSLASRSLPSLYRLYVRRSVRERQGQSQ
jgi:peptidoglycan/xylan/chitin deacetylase (PgdA/CDA1 family)